jgi:hypothetical protein
MFGKQRVLSISPKTAFYLWLLWLYDCFVVRFASVVFIISLGYALKR